MRFFNDQGRPMIHRAYATLFFCSTLIITNANASASQAIQVNNFQKLTSNNDIQLGAGYFTSGLYPLHNRCLQDMPIKVSNFQSRIALTYSNDLDQLSKNLNINISTDTGWGKFSSSAAADYIKSIQDDDYSINFNYQNLITMDTSLVTDNFYGTSTLNQGGATAYSNGDDSFIARCGDAYIQNLKMGAVLNVTLRIRFESQLQKKNFEASVKGKLGNIFNASAKISEAVQQKGIHGTIDVIGFQTGGKPNNLSQIFGTNDNHHITSCSLTQLEQCTKAIDDIIAYAQATGEWSDSGFAKQIQVINGTLIAESLSPVAIDDATFGSYESDFGLVVHYKSATREIYDARRKLNSLYEDMNSHLQFANAVIQSAAFKYLNNTIQEQIKTLTKTIKENLNLFNYEKPIHCFLPGLQNNCPEIAKKIEENMKSIDFSSLNLVKGAYYVNIGQVWPFVFVANNYGNMDIYDLGLVPTQQQTLNLNIIPSIDFSYIALRGGYSDSSDGNLTRYDMGYYGPESSVYYNRSTTSYIGTPAWKTCINDKCFKKNYSLEVFPF